MLPACRLGLLSSVPAEGWPPVHSGKPPGGGASRAHIDKEVEKRFANHFAAASREAVDLLIHLLHFEPHKRLSATEALAHPYVAQFHDPSAERTAPRPVKRLADEQEKKSTNFYREQLYTKPPKSSQQRGGMDSWRGQASGH